MNYSIVDVRKEHLSQLFAMLIDLVKHENLFERFKLTRERLEQELFEGDWHCLVACLEEKTLIGFCLYSYANINRAFNLSPMIQIDDLYVSPNHRRLGVGESLVNHLIALAKNKNISRLNVWCVKDNEQGQQFYKKIGAEKRDFIDVFSLPLT